MDEVLLLVPGHVYDRTDDIYYMMPESVCIHYIVTLSTRPDSHRRDLLPLYFDEFEYTRGDWSQHISAHRQGRGKPVLALMCPVLPAGSHSSSMIRMTS